MTTVSSVSIAAPAYNESAGIEEVVREWAAYLSADPATDAFEIVVCNDGSRDDTGAILDRLAAEIPQVKPVHFARNQGAAAALTNAIRHTTMDWVLLLDSDGQFPVENLEVARRAVIQSGLPAAIGVRGRKEDSVFARFGTWSSAVLCNLFHGVRLKDFNSAFKLVQGDLCRGLVLEAKGLNYSTEVTSRLLERGITFAEVPISHRKREKGTSSMKLVKGTVHRFLFVMYVGFRQLLLWAGVLQKVKYDVA